MAARSPRILAIVASSLVAARRGTAIPAKIPKTTITNISSIIVKAFFIINPLI